MCMASHEQTRGTERMGKELRNKLFRLARLNGHQGIVDILLEDNDVPADLSDARIFINGNHSMAVARGFARSLFTALEERHVGDVVGTHFNSRTQDVFHEAYYVTERPFDYAYLPWSDIPIPVRDELANS